MMQNSRPNKQQVSVLFLAIGQSTQAGVAFPKPQNWVHSNRHYCKIHTSTQRAKFMYITHSRTSHSQSPDNAGGNVFKKKKLVKSLHVKVISLYRYMTGCMFLFLVHMFFADCHYCFSSTAALLLGRRQSYRLLGKNTLIKEVGKESKGKKKENYILKGHCQV